MLFKTLNKMTNGEINLQIAVKALKAGLLNGKDASFIESIQDYNKNDLKKMKNYTWLQDIARRNADKLPQPETHKFVALVKIAGEIGQYCFEGTTIEATQQWAATRFNVPAVIVDMANYNNETRLSAGVAEMLYNQGTQEGFAVPPVHVIQVTFTDKVVKLTSYYNNQELPIPETEPGDIQWALNVAQKYLLRNGYVVTGRCPGKLKDGTTVGYLVSTTFKPFA